MFESQLLPHPIVVHFALALLPLAFVAEVGGLVVRRVDWLRHVAVLLLALGTSGAVVAFLTGRIASDSVGDVGIAASAAMNEHSDWATTALWIFVAIAAIRIGVAWLERRGPTKPSVAGRGFVVALLMPAMLVLLKTGEHGGELVFRHGVGVVTMALAPTVPPVQAADADNGTDVTGVTRGTDGTLVWEPLSTGSLDGAVQLSTGEGSFARVRETSPPVGLPLTVSGHAVLWLPDSFGDVVVRVRVELEGFEGQLGVIHHGDGEQRGEVFAAHTGGEVTLEDLGNDQVLDQARTILPVTAELTVSAVGRHLKGVINGKVVTHGHRPAPKPGRVGVLFEGAGDLSLIAFQAIPAR